MCYSYLYFYLNLKCIYMFWCWLLVELFILVCVYDTLNNVFFPITNNICVKYKLQDIILIDL